MTDAMLDLPSHLRERLAVALESGALPPQPSVSALRSVLGISDVDGPSRAMVEIERLGIAGTAAASWLRSLTKAEGRAPRTDLVWSGPEVAGLFARETRQVYEEVLGAAERSLWVSTYVYFDGPKAFELLAKRMDALQALRVTLLLNIGRRRGDTTGADQLVRRFAERLWRSEWPGKARPSVFYDPRALEPEAPGGVLHAKAVVADDQIVFVTSANLTEAALDRNIELGLLVRDRALALSLSTQFAALIERGLLKALPAD